MSEDKTPNSDDAVFNDVETPKIAVKRKSGVGFTSLLALLLSAVALAAVGLGYWRDMAANDAASANTAAEISDLVASISATEQLLQSLEQTVAALGAADAERDMAIRQLNRQLDERLRQVESVPGRLSTVESTLSSLQGISASARDTWLLAEAEYYMQVANAQLQLANNPELAMLALRHADERILALADPSLTNVRQALSDELRSLELLEKPDTAGITLTLASLANVVDSLPLQQQAPPETVSNEPIIDPQLTGMDRALASVRNTFDRVVTVRDAGDASLALSAPEARYFLRANLALQLQAARIALLRGEETIFRQSLDDAYQWLNAYYDVESTGVQSARRTIDDIRESVLRVAMPDISGSLRLLRQFKALTDSSREASPVVGDEPEGTGIVQ